MLQLNAPNSSRPLPKTATASKKFLQIVASIAAIGLVEPLIVLRIADDKDAFRILDGRLRVEALRRLGSTEALHPGAPERSLDSIRAVEMGTAGQVRCHAATSNLSVPRHPCGDPRL